MNGESEAQSEYARYRLERAREALAAADVLADAGLWNRCVNSIYYACFYAASALLVRHGLASPRHSGVLGIFQREFVRTGHVPRELGRFYQRMFERRQEGDYQDLIWFEESQVRPWIDQARQFITSIVSLMPDFDAPPTPDDLAGRN